MVVKDLKKISVGYHRNPGTKHIPRLWQQHVHSFYKFSITGDQTYEFYANRYLPSIDLCTCTYVAKHDVEGDTTFEGCTHHHWR